MNNVSFKGFSIFTATVIFAIALFSYPATVISILGIMGFAYAVVLKDVLK